jgi:hypothetical protein
MAIEYVEANKRLKFVVENDRPAPVAAGAPPATERNEWSYLQDRNCNANGDPKAPVNPSTCLITDAPPGALIAKIGGSVAGKTSDALKTFVVGSFCVIDLDANTKGTLYFTINADPMTVSERSGKLVVKIHRSL